MNKDQPNYEQTILLLPTNMSQEAVKAWNAPLCPTVSKLAVELAKLTVKEVLGETPNS